MAYPEDYPKVGQIWRRLFPSNDVTVRIKRINHVMSGNIMVTYECLHSNDLKGAIFHPTACLIT